jgi:hypothetical protein
MGATMRSTVKNAARLAVYEEMRINVKNHHTLPTIRPDIDLPTHDTQTGHPKNFKKLFNKKIWE